MKNFLAFDLGASSGRAIIGTLENGRAADITILAPDEKGVVDSSKFFSKSRNTPFNGYEYTGCAAATIVDGKCVFSRIDALSAE